MSKGNFGNAFFTPYSKEYDAQSMPVWLHVWSRKLAGGTLDISGYADGTIIPIGIPVKLDSMGGNVTILPVFNVEEAVTAESTTLVLSAGSGLAPAKGMIVGLAAADGSVAKAITLGDATALTGDDAGKYQFTITAGSLGTLAANDTLVIASAEGDNATAVKPTGLSWRQVVVDSDTPTLATFAVVTKGQILADRIPAVPDYYKAALPGIDFEYENE